VSKQTDDLQNKNNPSELEGDGIEDVVNLAFNSQALIDDDYQEIAFDMTMVIMIRSIQRIRHPTVNLISRYWKDWRLSVNVLVCTLVIRHCEDYTISFMKLLPIQLMKL